MKTEMTNILEVFEVIKRDAIALIHEDEFKQKLVKGKKLRIKLGADPSRPDLHLGHAVVLRKLRLLQNLGHEIVFVIGDFTGMIGDPSGKSKTRQPLTFEQTRANGESYFKQVTKILDKEKTTITYNSEWLSKMNFEQVLQLAGKYTVARILERDDFAKRYVEKEAIGMHELFYPLMQGYDSVALQADVEVGGSDQTFNLLVGRELQRDFGQVPQNIITFPLLPGLDGVEKMSKSLDNYIGIDEPAAIMFEKCMKVPDSVLATYFQLTTDIPEELFNDLMNQDIRNAHFVYALEIVGQYWGNEAAEEACIRYKEVASGSVPSQMETIAMNQDDIGLIELLTHIGFASTNSDARRLIQGKGIRVNHMVIEDVNWRVGSLDKQLLNAQECQVADNEVIIQKGKNKFVKVLMAKSN